MTGESGGGLHDGSPEVVGLLARWRPRLLARGVDDSDLAVVADRAQSWEGWLDAWTSVGNGYARAGEAALGRGHVRTAGESLVRAALAYHFGKFLWLVDVDRYADATRRSVDALGQGQQLLDPSFERVEIPYEGNTLIANLRRPTTGPAPVVILVPGLDSTKEEFPAWEHAFLDRGLATVSFDGPGQGESGLSTALRPDYEVGIAALLDVLRERDDIDNDRVGITGIGVGGYFAARAAAFEPRIAAVASVGGAYQYDRMPDLVRRKFLHSARIDHERAAELSARFTLTGIGAAIRQPFLVVYGEGDAVMTREQAQQPMLGAAQGEFVVLERGGTACQAAIHRLNPYLADWFADRLGGIELGGIKPSGVEPSGIEPSGIEPSGTRHRGIEAGVPGAGATGPGPGAPEPMSTEVSP